MAGGNDSGYKDHQGSYGAGRFMPSYPGQPGTPPGQAPGLMPWDYQAPQPELPEAPPRSEVLQPGALAPPALQPYTPSLATPERGGGGARSEPGYDPNQGAGTSDLSFLEGIKAYGSNILAVAGGPLGMAMLGARKGIGALRDQYDYKTGGGGGTVSAEQDEAYAGEIMNQLGRAGGGSVDWSGADTSGGRDYSGASVAAGGSGARDDIGFRDGGYGGRDGGDRDGGGHSGDARGGRDGGTSFHQGGPITDHNPKTYRENMPITAQEGEHVMSRNAVGLLGRDFLDSANQAAAK